LTQGVKITNEVKMTKTAKISIAMIVKNEEVMLEQCLMSVKEADEIIIIDTGSTDNTIKIASKYTDKIYTDYKWRDNFAEARNYANSKCTGDWILVLDADEELEIGGIKKIRKAIAETKGNSLDLIVYAEKTCFDSPRVFRNRKEIFWKGAVHNYINVVENNKTDIKIKMGYSPAHKNDPDRALRILTNEVAKNPQAVRETFYLGREYIYRKDWTAAIYWLEHYTKITNWPPEQAHGYLLLSKASLYMRQIDKAKDACLQAIKINADFKEALELMSYLSGPENKQRWLKFAKSATNKDVLFKQ